MPSYINSYYAHDADTDDANADDSEEANGGITWCWYSDTDRWGYINTYYEHDTDADCIVL